MADLNNLHLAVGSHYDRSAGVCFMEAAAWFADEPHTEHPDCVSPLLSEMGRALNDTLPDDLRQRLVPLIPQVVGTANDGRELDRSHLAMDWLIRAYAPAWLEAAGLAEPAARLRALPEIRQGTSVGKVVSVAQGVKDAAVDAVKDSVWDYVAVGAWSRSGCAVWDSVWDSAWGSARSKAWDTVKDASWYAARHVVRERGKSAANLTERALYESAVDLYTRMVKIS